MGLDFEVNSIAPGAVCQGTFQERGRGPVRLFHVIYTYHASGVFNGHIEETQSNTVSHDGRTYQGTFVQKFYDLNGNFLFEATGTLTATRIDRTRLITLERGHDFISWPPPLSTPTKESPQRRLDFSPARPESIPSWEWPRKIPLLEKVVR